MDYSTEILTKVRAFGEKQYSAQKVVSLISPENPEEFFDDLQNSDTPLCIMYQTGLNAEMNQEDAYDLSIKKNTAEQLAEQVKREKKVNRLINDFCGFDDD